MSAHLEAVRIARDHRATTLHELAGLAESPVPELDQCPVDTGVGGLYSEASWSNGKGRTEEYPGNTQSD